MFVSASHTTWRKLPPALLFKEFFTAVVASNKHSAVTLSVKWDISGHPMKLRIQFSKKVFAIPPDSE
jgi:hypothetical protein